MSSDTFYANLPPIANLIDLTESSNFVAVPANWHVVITDVVDSTKAILAGRYRDVNLLGSAPIAALLNLAGEIEIPFVFGGDGASILIPPSLLEATKELLIGIQEIARSRFQLTLRVGVVPASAIISAGYELKIAKLRISEVYHQALIKGGGLAYATELIKDYAIPNIYQHIYHSKNHKKPIAVDFSGLECRWRDIPSRHGEAVSLHVLAIAHNNTQNDRIYRDVLEKIQEIYGSNEYFHPVTHRHLHLSFSYKKLLVETKLRAPSNNRLSRFRYLCQISLENLLGFLFMRFKLVLGGVEWGIYKKLVVAATDYQKFDDLLHMLISGTSSQSSELMHYLNRCYQDGKLVYGIHISKRVLMTCLVFERNGTQVHFIDGADGGFTLAARDLKERMRHKALNWKTLLKLIKLQVS